MPHLPPPQFLSCESHWYSHRHTDNRPAMIVALPGDTMNPTQYISLQLSSESCGKDKLKDK